MRQFLLAALLFLTMVSNSYSQDFEHGHYTDYSDIKHEGLIRIKEKDGGFKFKESEDSKPKRISVEEAKYFKMGEREFYVKSFDTFHETWESRSSLDILVDQIKKRYFVELIEKGRVNAYVHSDLEFNSPIPNRDKEYYLEKGSLVKKMNSSENINLPLKLFGTLKKFIDDDSIYLEKYQAKIYKDDDWLTLIRDYNNKYRELRSKQDTILIFRSNKKQSDSPILMNINEKGSWELYPNTLVKIVVDDITDFQICMENSNCMNFTGSLIRENYFEAFQSTDEQPIITYADQETGKYYATRIEYLMKKAKKKSSKRK